VGICVFLGFLNLIPSRTRAFRGYESRKKIFNQVELLHDLEPIGISELEAQKFKLQHGDKCDAWAGDGGQWFAKFKKGAIFILKPSHSAAQLLVRS